MNKIVIQRNTDLTDKTFEIIAKVEDQKTGRRRLLLVFPDQELSKIVRCSAQAIISTLVSLGLMVRKKELFTYLSSELFERSRHLQVYYIPDFYEENPCTRRILQNICRCSTNRGNLC